MHLKLYRHEIFTEDVLNHAYLTTKIRASHNYEAGHKKFLWSVSGFSSVHTHVHTANRAYSPILMLQQYRRVRLAPLEAGLVVLLGIVLPLEELVAQLALDLLHEMGKVVLPDKSSRRSTSCHCFLDLARQTL